MQGHTLVAEITGGKSRVIGEKISPVAIPEAWVRRIGKWAPVDTQGPKDCPLYLTLRREAEFLMLDIVIGSSIAPVWALSPLGDGEAVIAGDQTGHVRDDPGQERGRGGTPGVFGIRAQKEDKLNSRVTDKCGQ